MSSHQTISPRKGRGHAKTDKIDLVMAELLKLLDITRAEKGCIQYDLHQDNENPAHFLFFENWKDRDLWQVHMAAPHLAAYLTATEGAVDAFTLNETTKIG
ncbi:MAG: putative quinol monooxygenase [Geminicoccaceae bacterium]